MCVSLNVVARKASYHPLNLISIICHWTVIIDHSRNGNRLKNDICQLDNHLDQITFTSPVSIREEQGRFPWYKVPGANMGPIWGRHDPGGPHVGPMSLAIWVVNHKSATFIRHLMILPICPYIFSSTTGTQYRCILSFCLDILITNFATTKWFQISELALIFSVFLLSSSFLLSS